MLKVLRKCMLWRNACYDYWAWEPGLTLMSKSYIQHKIQWQLDSDPLEFKIVEPKSRVETRLDHFQQSQKHRMLARQKEWILTYPRVTEMCVLCVRVWLHPTEPWSLSMAMHLQIGFHSENAGKPAHTIWWLIVRFVFYGVLVNFQTHAKYPLVNAYTTMENHHFGKTHYFNWAMFQFANC